MLQPLQLLLAALPLVASSSLSPPQHIFSNPPSPSDFKIPTVHESAIQARRILRLEGIGTLSTIFPSPSTPNDASSLENRPSGLGGTPIGLMDYVGDCEPEGNPTILAINIATSFKNVAAGSNISLSLRWHPPNAPYRYSTASLPRFSLLGHLEEMEESEIRKMGVAACFVKTHPDAAGWLPGNPIHTSRWTRLVVDYVYWIGGFGDRAYIGWIPAEEWRSVTESEIEECRLPGEKKGWGDYLSRFWEL